MGGTTGSGVTASSVTSADVTNDRVTGPPGGVVPVGVPGEASEYFLNEIGNANPGLSGGTRLDVFWRQDGLKVWTARQGDTIRQYSVSPAWGIDSGDWTFEFTTAAIGNLRSIWWSPDGTVFSHCQRVPSTSVRVTTFDQSASPWDISGGFGASTTKAWTPTGGVTPQDIIWSEDGTRLWMQGPIGVTAPILEFSVPTPYDMTTLINAQVKSFDGVGNNTLAFSNDGLFLYMMFGQVLNSYEMSIAFDIDTLTNLIAGPSVPAGNVTIPRGLTFRDDNADIFVAGDQNQRRCAYFRKSAGPDINEFTFNAEETLSGSANVALQVGLWVSEDGEHVYTCRESISVSDFFQFSMSPGHDLSSIAFVAEDDGDGQSPRGIAASENGDMIFDIWRNPTNPDGIFGWPMSPNWDVQHNGVRDTLSPLASGNLPRGLHFKPDGTELYHIDQNDGLVYQYTMSVAYDVSTGTQTNTFDYTTEVANAVDLTMSADGTKMYIMDLTNDNVEQYNLTVPFDLSSAVASGVTPLDLTSGGTGVSPRGISLRDNDSKLYVVYNTNDILEQWTT